VRAGPIGAGGSILEPYVPTGAVTRPRICRRHGGLVSAAELLIRLARVEDEPGDLMPNGQMIDDGLTGVTPLTRPRAVDRNPAAAPRRGLRSS
jgi:hypothetical protein